MRLPRRKAIIVVGVVGLLVVAGASAQAGWLFVLAACVGGLLGGSLLMPGSLAGYSVARKVPDRVTAGAEVRVDLRLENEGRRATPLARLEDRFPALEPESFVCEPTPPGGIAGTTSIRHAARRGVYDAGEVRLVGAAPFGFFGASRSIDVPSRMTVLPSWVDLRTFPILEHASAPHDVLHERARTGAGEEYMGVRPYRAGDPRRFVHWRSSARRGRLVVREYEEHVQATVAVVLAGADFGPFPDSLFELLVSAAASISNYALATGHPLELLSPDADGMQRLTRPSRVGALDRLASAKPNDLDLGSVISECLPRMGRRGTVVILAPSVGRAAESLTAALGSIQGGGARGVAVVARASTWDQSATPVEDEEEFLRRVGSGRVTLKVLEKDKELRECLQG